MNFNGLTEFLKNVDHNLIHDCEIVVFKEHKCIYKNRFTADDVDPSEDKKDMYYLFSATKVITATATMRLVEEGKIGLDDPVKKYLPEFAELYVLKGGEKVKAKNVLTVRHLLSMQGGFNYNLGHEEIVKIKEQSGNMASTREVVSAIAKMPLVFEPGENYLYSLCHDVLAAIIEVVTGKSYYEYLKEIIFIPLEMNDMTFTPTPEVLARMKQQYMVDLKTNTSLPQAPTCNFRLTENYQSGGAGLIGTLNDYIKFADTLASGESANGYRLLKPETIELMKTNQLTGASFDSFKRIVKRSGYSYALGVRTLINQNLAHSLSPIGEFGWDGAAGAYCMIDTENKLSCYFAQHLLGCEYTFTNVHPAIRNHIYKALEE